MNFGSSGRKERIEAKEERIEIFSYILTLGLSEKTGGGDLKIKEHRFISSFAEQIIGDVLYVSKPLINTR